MIAGCLKATNFRNLEEICFEPCPGVNVLFGDNAQGKTNLDRGALAVYRRAQLPWL